MSDLSIVIPTYTINPELEEMAYQCALSYKDQAKEIIICEDGGNYSAKLKSIADTYIYNKKNVGFSANVNRGWRYAQSEWVAIVSSDTYLVSGNLEDLCLRAKVTSPLIENQTHIDTLTGSFWVAHKTCTKVFGMLDEKMRTYYCDDDYYKRIEGVFKKVNSVVIHHHQAKTVKAAGVEGGEENEKDRQAYNQKA